MKDEPPERSPTPVRRTTTGPALLASAFGITLFALPFGSLSKGLSSLAVLAQFDIGTGVLLVLAFVAVMAASGAFVSGEAAVEFLRPTHVKMFDDNTQQQRVLRDLVDRKPHFVAACVLGAETMRAWLLLLCLIPAPFMAMQFGWIGPESPWHSALGPVIGAAAILSVPVVGLNVIFSELVGRSYAAVHPHRVALRLYRFITLASLLFAIPGRLGMAVAGLFTQRFGAEATFAPGSKAEEEIRGILESYEETGEIEEQESEMLHSVFEFGDSVAREVMTPRTDVESVPTTTSISEVARIVEESGHSRLPVFEGTDDQIVGIVHAKDVLSALAAGQSDKPLAEIVRPALFVPESKPLHDLLKEMRQHKTQLAVVQDEFGGTAGIVTVEDMVEELVGEIVDEYDTEDAHVHADGDGWTVNGRLHLDDLNDVIGSDLESEEFDTVGGYVFGLFGRQPVVGEEVEDSGFKFVVSDSDGRRILALRIEKVKSERSLATELLGEA
ncbi:MAG: HlyC/CorC family transporter [Armatimonadetes bacterium]|nr:HlyC/CorC family transporter [Armatimonadota bacterium]